MGVADGVSGAFASRTQLSEPEIHDVLRNERRRETLRCLRSHAGEAHLDDLTDSIVRREGGADPEASDLRRSVYSSLHQTHLPKLEAADVISYDENTRVVRLAGNSREVDRYFGLRAAYGVSWGEYYQLFAATSLVISLLVELEIGVFAVVSLLPVLTVALSLLALSVGYQLWSRRWVYLRSLFSGPAAEE